MVFSTMWENPKTVTTFLRFWHFNVCVIANQMLPLLYHCHSSGHERSCRHKPKKSTKNRNPNWLFHQLIKEHISCLEQLVAERDNCNPQSHFHSRHLDTSQFDTYVKSVQFNCGRFETANQYNQSRNNCERSLETFK